MPKASNLLLHKTDGQSDRGSKHQGSCQKETGESHQKYLRGMETTLEELNRSDREVTQTWHITKWVWGSYYKKRRVELIERVSEATEYEGEGNE